MFLRKMHRRVDGERKAYWALVESYRTERGPRQRVVAHLGELDDAGRVGVQHAAEERGASYQGRLFDEVKPRYVSVDTSRVSVERCRQFGGPWLGLELCRQLGLTDLLNDVMPAGREEVPWPLMALVLVLARLCEPSSELHIAEHWYGKSAISDLLGIPDAKIEEHRLYRALDALLPHKTALERHLKDRLGTLFGLQYDLLMYDMTSTYFEGLAEGNPQAQRGYSRDHRGDCKQVTIALVVSREGVPLGYEVFAGNRADVTTVEDVVEAIEAKYGQADRIWVMDRGMVSEDNLAFLREENRRYIVGTPKGMLKRYEQQLLEQGWEQVREGLEVKRCPSPDGSETFILCRSADRADKERAMLLRFAKRIETGLERMAAGCQKRKQKPTTVARRVGRLLGQNTRAEQLFDVNVGEAADGRATVTWTRREAFAAWAELSEGCYLLRSNVTDWSGEELWRAYVQLTQAEAAFRIQKDDLRIRPIWHQKEERVQAHILVCFLAYVLWKTLALLCERAGLGCEPRKVLEELQSIQMVDVVMPTRQGPTIRKRCVSRPTDHQNILLQRLGLKLPDHMKITDV